jgi:hypothetical protein
VVKTFINRGKEEFFKSYSTSKEGWEILCGIDLNEKYHVNKLDEKLMMIREKCLKN